MKSTQINPEVQALVVQARHQVAARLNKLLKEAPMIAAVGQERAGRLLAHTACGGSTLLWVASEVRQALVERPTTLGPLGLWHVLDPLYFLDDCSEQRWPYFTDDQRRQRLQWVNDEMDQLEGLVWKAMEPAADAQAAPAQASTED